MQQKDQKDKEDVRLSGQARAPKDKVPTYQEALDEALENTFPASDPVAASAAAQPRDPQATPRDQRDWALEPGAGDPANTAAAQASRRASGSAREPASEEAKRLRQQSEDALDNVREGHERPIDDSPARPSPDRVKGPAKGRSKP